jgi:LmbE family N-acetylglucosaminyl deacetylase
MPSNLHRDLEREPPPPLPLPGRALAVGAHPDDVEFGAGGVLAAWALRGTEVSLIVVTDGSKGSWDPDEDRDALVATRQAEARAAAEALGAARVLFLGEVDGELEPDRRLKAEIARWIRRLRPDVVLTHDPWQRYQLHPDHRATGWIVADAVVAARDPLFFPEQLGDGLAAHRPGALLLWSADEPDHWEDVSDGLDRKVAALLCHTSQGQTTMRDAHRDEAARDAFSAEVAAWAARTGTPAGLRAAEAFRRVVP